MLLCFNLQVDRLEQEVVELRRSQEAQATAAAARAQTTGVLEEYRTRAQQALKRANEITSQTASENKRLEVCLGGLFQPWVVVDRHGLPGSVIGWSHHVGLLS